MTEETGGRIVKLTDRFVETAIGDETVIMRLADGDFFALDGTSLAIWQAIDGARDRAKVSEAVGLLHQGDPVEIRRDVDAFIGELVAAGFVAG